MFFSPLPSADIQPVHQPHALEETKDVWRHIEHADSSLFLPETVGGGDQQTDAALIEHLRLLKIENRLIDTLLQMIVQFGLQIGNERGRKPTLEQDPALLFFPFDRIPGHFVRSSIILVK